MTGLVVHHTVGHPSALTLASEVVAALARAGHLGATAGTFYPPAVPGLETVRIHDRDGRVLASASWSPDRIVWEYPNMAAAMVRAVDAVLGPSGHVPMGSIPELHERHGVPFAGRRSRFKAPAVDLHTGRPARGAGASERAPEGTALEPSTDMTDTAEGPVSETTTERYEETKR